MNNKYSNWTDFEVDLEITARETSQRPVNKVKEGARVYVAIDLDNEHVPQGAGLVYVDIVRYTSKWEEIGPVIDKYNLTIGPCVTGKKMAACYRGGFDDIVVFNDSTLRSVAEVILILTDG
jgi:hypothetical protein